MIGLVDPTSETSDQFYIFTHFFKSVLNRRAFDELKGYEIALR